MPSTTSSHPAASSLPPAKACSPGSTPASAELPTTAPRRSTTGSIPNRLYSRLVWSTHPREYVDFARQAVADSDGPMLDTAGGTAVFTADPYREATRPIVFSDLSLGMLAKARERLEGSANVAFVQADATDPPFAPGAFATVACMGALHVFPDPGVIVRALRPLVAEGGAMFLSGLVAETRVGSAYLRLLERAGEAGPRLSQAELEAVVAEAAGTAPATVRKGSMTYLVLRPG